MADRAELKVIYPAATEDFLALNSDTPTPPNDTRKASKYHNVRTTLGDRVYSSGKEAARAGELQLMEKAGEIFGLCFQVRFELYGGVKYIADFVYSQIIDGKLQTVVEDKKGFKTPQYKDKAKNFKAKYGIEIRES